MGGNSSSSPSVKDVQSGKSNDAPRSSSRKSSFSDSINSAFRGKKSSEMTEEVSFCPDIFTFVEFSTFLTNEQHELHLHFKIFIFQELCVYLYPLYYIGEIDI